MAWYRCCENIVDFDKLPIVTVYGRTGVFGGAGDANKTFTATTSTYTVTKTGKATLIFGGFGASQVGGFYGRGATVYHNGSSLLYGTDVCNKITVDVAAGDTIYATASWLTDSDTTTSKCAQGYVVLTVIEHD